MTATEKNVEKWKPVVGHEGLYEVSSMGRVRSLPRELPSKNGSFRKWKGKVLKPEETTKGYLRVVLTGRGSNKHVSIHRTVCLAFHGPPPRSSFVVCHNNGNNQDNRAENLRWDSQRSNAIDTITHGSGVNKIDAADAAAIKSLVLTSRFTYRQIGDWFGVTKESVSGIANGRTWTHVEPIGV